MAKDITKSRPSDVTQMVATCGIDSSGDLLYDAEGNPAGSTVVRGVGLTGVAHNRNIAAAATTHPGDGTNNVATWTAAENVREITITPIIAAAGTPAAIDNEDACLVVVNAPSDATAQTWLTDAGSAAQDVLYELVHIGQSLTIQRTSAITQVDVLPISEAMRVIIAAVGD